MAIKIGIGRLAVYRGGGGQSWSSYWATRKPRNGRLTVLSATSIKYDWDNTGLGFTGHSVERSDDNGLTFAEINIVLIGTNTFTDTGLTNGATYVYRVRAYNGTNYSDYDEEVMTTISTLLNGLVFALKWDGSQFINAVTGLALVNNGGATNGDPVLPNSGTSARLAIAQSQFLSTPDTEALSIGNVNFTVAVFGKLSDTTRAAIQALAGQYDGTNNQRAWLLQCRKDGTLRFTVSWDGINIVTNYVSIAGAIADNSKNLVLAWHDADNNQLGIQLNNGVAVIKEDANAKGVFDSNADITIGAIDDGTLLADGDLSVLIWKNKLLNATEKEFLYNAANGNQFPFNLYDVFVIAGQSNASGRSTNSQSFTKTGSFESLLFANDYTIKANADPVDSTTNQVDAVSLDSIAPDGSIYPLIATALSALNKKTMFIPCAMGGTYIADWQPGANHVDRTTLYGSMIYRAKQIRSVGGNIKAVMWWQGEADSIAPISVADYNTALDSLANAIKADLGVKLMPCKLHDLTPLRDEANVNAAIALAWSDNDNVLTGPDLSDIVQDDTCHIKTDEKTATIAARWVTAIRNAFGW